VFSLLFFEGQALKVTAAINKATTKNLVFMFTNIIKITIQNLTAKIIHIFDI